MTAILYDDNVFINCPFDEAYQDIFYAIVYTVYRCGFCPKCALEEDNALDNRLHKIERLIEESRYGIHDISRIELNPSNLPRFNMPFELGIFFGAKKFGNVRQKNKAALIFEKQKFLYQQYISDLSGIDTKAHGNEPVKVIRFVRNWLAATSKRSGLPGDQLLIREFRQFRTDLPILLKEAHISPHELSFNDLCQIVEEVIRQNIRL
jgi:hypothetical protein